MSDSFSTRSRLDVNGQSYTYFSLPTLGQRFDIARLPYSMKILLENLLRCEDGVSVTPEHIEAVAKWDATREPDTEIAFMPARVVLQDFTGVPCVVDLAAMRDAVVKLGGNPDQINPLIPSELVIDHSVQVDVFGKPDALDLNGKIEFDRNKERYSFLRWGQKAFRQLQGGAAQYRHRPPGEPGKPRPGGDDRAEGRRDHRLSGHRVRHRLAHHDDQRHRRARLGRGRHRGGSRDARPALVDAHPAGGGLQADRQAPRRHDGDHLFLTVTQMLRALGVVGKFVEFYGDGLQHLPLADRATIGNMAPEYGATCGIFPIDAESLNYLRLSGRSEAQIALVEAYAKAQGLWHDADSPHAQYSATLHLDMGDVKPSLAGPKRPQDRVLLEDVKKNFRDNLQPFAEARDKRSEAISDFVAEGGGSAVGNEALSRGYADIETEGQKVRLKDGAVVIAAITSCTNTSNPAVMIGAGLLARNAAAKGLTRKPWVKTSLGPGSRVVTDYLEKAGVLDDLEKLGFYVVGYGCTTCIGNSGPLPVEVSAGIATGDLVVTSVLSGNRNFEGRVHPEVKMNYLASPPLVVAYAIAGTTDIDLTTEPLGIGNDGQPVYLKDIWPSNGEIGDFIARTIGPEMFAKNYADVFKGDTRWNTIASPDGDLYAWDSDSTYIKNPPYFDGMTMATGGIDDVHGARVLGLFGDSITTDHISPAGNIKKDSPAGRFLISRGVQPVDFNSYGSRRGNDDVMVRGTFANIRIKNLMFGGEEGGNTLYHPPGGGAPEKLSIYDAAMKYKADGVPLVVLAGKEYGTGSSRDWAAKGTTCWA